MTHDFSPRRLRGRGGITARRGASAAMPAADTEAGKTCTACVLTSLIRCVYSVFYLRRSGESLGEKVDLIKGH